MIKSYTITPENEGKRLDLFLAERLGTFSRSHIQQAINSGNITVNNDLVKPSHKLKNDDLVKINLSNAQHDNELKGEEIPLDIVFENEDVIVINKQPGLVVHPGSGNQEGTLVNALVNHFPPIKQVVYDPNNLISRNRPGLVHRLDKDTSGLLIVAKNARAMHSLSRQIQNRTANKSYLALCYGWPKNSSGRLINYLGRHPQDRKKMADIGQDRGKEAISDYEVLDYYQDNFGHKISLANFNIKTGRTHQIRVQAALMHTPILGDTVYGTKESEKASKIFGIKRQLLHSHELEIYLPGNNKLSKFIAPLPLDFERTLSNLTKIEV